MSLQRTYQNFHLAILEDSEPGTYRMVVSDSPMGEQPPVAAVIDHEDLTQDLSQLKPHHPQKGLISFGQRLSEVLFPGPLRDLFRRSLESIPPEDGMRLCLQMDNPHLASFPWELCCLPEAPGKATFSDFLALNPRISIHRVFPTAHPGTNPPLSPHLVIAIAEHTYGSTTDQSPLWSLYKKPIEINGRQLEVAWEDHLTQESLSVILAKEPGLFQLVGRFDTQGDTGGENQSQPPEEATLLLREDANRIGHLPMNHLAKEIRKAGVILVVMTTPVDRQTFLLPSIVAAQQLIQEIPYVLLIPEWEGFAFGKDFYHDFYTGLLAGLSIDEALSLARLDVFSEEGTISWGFPILFSRGVGDALFPLVDETEQEQSFVGSLSIQQNIKVLGKRAKAIGVRIEELDLSSPTTPVEEPSAEDTGPLLEGVHLSESSSEQPMSSSADSAGEHDLSPTLFVNNPNTGQPSLETRNTYLQQGWRVEKVIQISGSVTFEGDSWDQIDFGPHLARLQNIFIDQMFREGRPSSGAPLEQARSRYVKIPLQKAEKLQLKDFVDKKQTGNTVQTRLGDWENLIQYPSSALIIGEAGSGKTTLLLYQAQALASRLLEKRAGPVPIYLSLASYQGGDSDALLKSGAQVCGVDPRAIMDLWYRRGHPLFFLLDGVDEVASSHIPTLARAVKGLFDSDQAKIHSLVIASRPGAFLEEIGQIAHENLDLVWIQPFDIAKIDELLGNYDANELKPALDRDPGLLKVFSTPGNLVPLARSKNIIIQRGLPDNAGETFRLFVDYSLFGNTQRSYDYALILRPVLAFLAYSLLRQEQSSLIVDDDLYAQIAQLVEPIYLRYERLRKVMPERWDARSLLQELAQSPVLFLNEQGRIGFRDGGYRDYFAAVYLETAETGPAMKDPVTTDANLERWLNPLILLLGLRKDSGKVFDALFTNQPGQAADLWFEKRPYGIDAPSCIQEHFSKQIDKLDALSQETPTNDLVQRVIRLALQFESYPARLKFTNYLTGMGPVARRALLDAASDNHPLVQAAARYALLHMGEDGWQGSPESNLAPLITVEENHFQFNCSTSGSIHLGPLHFLETPSFIRVNLSIRIGHLDFDPFDTDYQFDFRPTPLDWLITDWFATTRTVDWIGLTARCEWLTRLSLDIARLAGDHPALSEIVQAMELRAARYASLGRLLARDLGMSVRVFDSVSSLPAEKEETSQIYHQLRSDYNRLNRHATFEISTARRPQAFKTSTSIENLEGSMRSVEINRVTLPDSRNMERSKVERISKIQFAQDVGNINGGSMSGMKIDALYGAPQAVPPTLSIQGSLKAQTSEQGTIQGLTIDRVIGGAGGLEAAFEIHIDDFHSSTLFGIVIGSDQDSEKGQPTSSESLPGTVTDSDADSKEVQITSLESRQGASLPGIALDEI